MSVPRLPVVWPGAELAGGVDDHARRARGRRRAPRSRPARPRCARPGPSRSSSGAPRPCRRRSKRTTARDDLEEAVAEPGVLQPEPEPDRLAGGDRPRRTRASPRRGSARAPRQPSSITWPGPHTSPGWITLRAADLPAADADLLGQAVHHAFHGELRLVGAEARGTRRTPGCWCAPRTPRRRSSGRRYGPLAWPAARSSTFMPDRRVRARSRRPCAPAAR